jgi:hypothetical protein
MSHASPLGLTILVLLAAYDVDARVVSSSANGFLIENVAVVPVDARTAWRALIEDVGAWWPADHTWFGRSSNLRIEARAGGCFCEVDGDRQVMHMTIGFVDPGRLLRMLGGLGPLQGLGVYGALDWRLEPLDAGTRVTLRYQAGGYPGEGFEKLVPVVDSVQGTQLGGLVEYLRRRHDTAAD